MTRSTVTTATIVAAVDGSPASLRAFAYAAGIARRERARLICVHVRQPTALVRIASAPFTELTALATEVRADLIVTGAPGSLLGRIFPTLPSRVLRRRKWPVVVIP